MRDRIKALKRIDASKLVPHPENWRVHPEKQRKALQTVLGSIGWADAIIARQLDDGTYQILDGHLRAESTDGKVPVLVVDLDDNEARILLATHDPLASMAQTNDELVRDMMSAIDATDDLDDLLRRIHKDSLIDPDDDLKDVEPQLELADQLQQKWGTQQGQLWTIKGKQTHRLLCGDSTNPDDVTRVMNCESAWLMATDPPYGVDFAGAKYNPRAKKWDAIENDKHQGGDLTSFIADMLTAWLPHTEKAAGFYFWTAAMNEGAAAAAAIRNAGLHIQSQIIWNKNCLVLGQADYHWKHENCWYAFRKGEKHRWLGGRDKTTVWDVAKVANSSYVHPMQKPLELYSIPMAHHTNEGELVCEPFAGSGSQFVAAEQMNRRCNGIELMPKYVAVILQRMSDAGCTCQMNEK